MKNIMNIIGPYVYPLWFGFSMGMIGFNPFSWQIWFVGAPTILLINMFFDKKVFKNNP